MAEQLNINDDVKILKLEILSKNLKQNWNLDTDLWNEEFPHDYRFEDTYLQLSFVLRDFNMNELKHLISITNLFDIKNYNHEIATLIFLHHHLYSVVLPFFYDLFIDNLFIIIIFQIKLKLLLKIKMKNIKKW